MTEPNLKTYPCMACRENLCEPSQCETFQVWLRDNQQTPALTAIIAEFGSVEECVKAARYGRECTNQQAWKDNYQEESDGS